METSDSATEMMSWKSLIVQISQARPNVTRKHREEGKTASFLSGKYLKEKVLLSRLLKEHIETADGENHGYSGQPSKLK